MNDDTRRTFIKKSLLTAGMTPVTRLAAEQRPGNIAAFDTDVTSPAYPWTHLKFRNNPDNFQFAVCPDLTGRERLGVFQDAVAKLNMLQPEFVISSGDVIEGHTNDKEQLNRDWDLFMNHVAPLEMPFFYLPGNHDYWFETTQDPAGADVVYDMRTVYEKHAGPPYYHFVYKNVLFLILQNTVGEIPEFYARQNEYVTKILARYREVRWTFVFFHYPLWFEELGDVLMAKLWHHVRSVLADRPFTAFGGNSHEYVYYERNNRDYIEVATAGGMSRMRGVGYGEIDHLVWVTMQDDGPRFANLLLEGIYPKNLRTELSAMLSRSLLREPPLRAPILFQAAGPFQPLTTQIHITNTSDYDLAIAGSFQPHDALVPEPSTINTKVPAKTKQSLDVKLRSTDARAVLAQEVHPLVFRWTATQDLSPKDPDVCVEGNLRIVVDVHGERVPASIPYAMDDFANGRLGPDWTIVGPGGHASEGHYTLSDDPSVPDQNGCMYIDGKGGFVENQTWRVPAAGIYRDVPPDTFDCRLLLTDMRWGGDTPVFRWEFWDGYDEVNSYGPRYFTTMVLQLTQRVDKAVIQMISFDYRASDANRTEFDSYPYLPDSRWKICGEAELPSLPEKLSLQARWRESARSWIFTYGPNDGGASRTVGEYQESPGRDFTGQVSPGFRGKRNVIYVRQAAKEKGFAVSLEQYALYI